MKTSKILKKYKKKLTILEGKLIRFKVEMRGYSEIWMPEKEIETINEFIEDLRE